MVLAWRWFTPGQTHQYIRRWGVKYGIPEERVQGVIRGADVMMDY